MQDFLCGDVKSAQEVFDEMPKKLESLCDQEIWKKIGPVVVLTLKNMHFR